MSERVRLAGVAKRYGGVIAVYPTDLSVKQGEFVVLLGPSGSGKTSTLRMIAGLERPSQGQVFLSGKDVTRLSPGERDIAFVFQFFSLYPHLTAAQNVSFPLRAAGLSEGEADARAKVMLERLGLADLAGALPRRLSGGDQQRVGLARALVRTPQVFLMDEPLGTLDGTLRARMRETLRAIHNESGATTLFVTHDQEEAMGLADRIAVMREGRIIQCDSPRALYENPANLFVADFLGSPGMNILPAVRMGEEGRVGGINLSARLAEDPDAREASLGLSSGPNGELPCMLGVRPENVVLSESGAACVVEHTEALGSHNLLALRLGDGPGILKALMPAGVRFREGEKVSVNFMPSGCRWFDRATGEALPWKTMEVACSVMR
jgi:multiple sugar transport system ATP-binding protein